VLGSSSVNAAVELGGLGADWAWAKLGFWLFGIFCSRAAHGKDSPGPNRPGSLSSQPLEIQGSHG